MRTMPHPLPGRQTRNGSPPIKCVRAIVGRYTTYCRHPPTSFSRKTPRSITASRATCRVKNQITKGQWVVRGVDWVDTTKRQIWFAASGMYPGKDPYFVHHYRINFDGTGLTAITDADGTHTVSFSPDKQYYVDLWSRVDLPPVLQLRRTSDLKVLMNVERADASALLATGWRPPEVFTAKGRDGKTDIWGVIIRPMNFDPNKKYPVIENIYAGPQDSFVPKTFGTQAGMQAQAE